MAVCYTQYILAHSDDMIYECYDTTFVDDDNDDDGKRNDTQRQRTYFFNIENTFRHPTRGTALQKRTNYHYFS